jgi:hypothetical protein
MNTIELLHDNSDQIQEGLLIKLMDALKKDFDKKENKKHENIIKKHEYIIKKHEFTIKLYETVMFINVVSLCIAVYFLKNFRQGC